MSTCGNCGYELEVAADSCPLCGTPVGAVSGAGGTRTAAAGQAVGPPAPPVAWENPDAGFPANFVSSYADAIGRPSRFFARLRYDSPLARPLLFYLLVVVIAAFFTLLLTAAIGVPEGLEEMFGDYDLGIEMSGGAVALVTFFSTPFVLLFALLINSLIIHLFVAMLIRERRSLGATTRVLCYAIAPYPVTAIPVIGPLASSVWIAVLVILGLREAHRTTTGRAAAAVLIPLAILVGFYLLLVAFALMLSVVEPS